MVDFSDKKSIDAYLNHIGNFNNTSRVRLLYALLVDKSWKEINSVDDLIDSDQLTVSFKEFVKALKVKK